MQDDKVSEQKPTVPVEVQKAAPDVEAPEKLTGMAQLRKAFSAAMARTRPQPNPQTANRGADKTKKVLALGVLAAGLAIVFLVVFSSPRKPATAGSNRNKPNLGAKETPGSERQETNRSVTPIMTTTAQPAADGNNGEVTAEDVNRTSGEIPRYKPQSSGPQTKTSPRAEANSLRSVSFDTTPTGGEAAPSEGSASATTKLTLNKPSIVFIRAEQIKVPDAQAAIKEAGNALTGVLPQGTKLVARLESPVSSAINAPAIAVIEYNYEHDGEIVVPAGTKAIGKLEQVSSSGTVNLQFSRLELPDGTTEKIEASAMSLSYGPLKGNVSGRKRGTRFLVSAVTGLGSMASLLAGSNSASTLDAPVSEGSLLRERLADNIGQAGQQELNNLTFNQNIVVTVPGSTRFYLVLQHGSVETPVASTGIRALTAAASGTSPIPTVEELRQLMELRREINQVYEQQAAVPYTKSDGSQ